MGIQINGNNDIISALDGSWTAEGASINTSGILTATTFKGNIVGTAATFTGPVTIGGTLTYEDVTNIDSVGIVTARGGIDCNGDIDVDGHTNLDNVSIAGVTTITGASGTLLQVTHTAGSGGQGIIRTKATDANSSSFIRAEDSGSTYIGLLKYGTGHSAYGALGAGDGALYANSGGGNDTNITIMADSSTGYINFATGGNTERLRITSDGKIGINQTTWTDKDHMFEVAQSTNDKEIARFTNLGGVSGSVKGKGFIGLSVFNGTTYPHASIGVEENNNATHKGALTFATRNVSSDSAPEERMRIASTGKVGVGTDNPVGNLEVRDSKANLIVAKDGLPVKSNSDLAASYDMIQLGAGGALASYSATSVTADTMFIHNAYRHSGNDWKRRYQDTAARMRVNSPANTWIFETAATGNADSTITSWDESLRIDSSGKVGINDTNPSHQLSVIGDSRLYGTVIVGNNTNISPSSAGAGQLKIDGLGYTGYMAADGTAMYVGHNSSSRDFVLQTDETDRLTIDGSTGNIGIGTGDPASLLSLYSDAEDEELLRFDMGSPTQRRGWVFKQKDTGTGTDLRLQAISNGKSFVVTNSAGTDHFEIHTANSGPYVRMLSQVRLDNDIVHTGDTDTKFGFPAADTISMETAGSERLRIASSGQIGIAGANYGTDGQVLTSKGSGAAVQWADAGGVWTQINSQQISSSVSQVDVSFGANAGITTSYAQIKVYYDVWLNSGDKLYLRGAYGFSGTFTNDVKTSDYWWSGFYHRAGESSMNWATQGENQGSALISANSNKTHHSGEMLITNAAGRLYDAGSVSWPALVYNTQGYSGGDNDAHNFTISGHLKGGDNNPLQGIRVYGGQNIIAGEVRTYGLAH